MNCPACDQTLTVLDAGTIELEACTSGCGGVWLDSGELSKVDESIEPCAPAALRVLANAKVVVDHSKPRKCPKCADARLERMYYRDVSHLEIDCCPNCEGVWLDLGELMQVRAETDLQLERQAAIDEFNASASKVGSPELRQRINAVLQLLFR